MEFLSIIDSLNIEDSEYFTEISLKPFPFGEFLNSFQRFAFKPENKQNLLIHLTLQHDLGNGRWSGLS